MKLMAFDNTIGISATWPKHLMQSYIDGESMRAYVK